MKRLESKMKLKVKDFGMIDALILASARKRGLKILTGDKHFENFETHVWVLFWFGDTTNFVAQKFIYRCSKLNLMTKVVYSIRISEEVKKMMECIDLNWQEELRKVVEDRVREEYKKKLLNKARELRKKMKTSVSAAELIREDRDER